jgi:Fic family protein
VSAGFASRDEQEVVGYAKTIETIFENYDHIVLSENYIKQLHMMLLQYSKKDERHRGDYKKLSNNVEAFDAQGKSLGIIFETSTPFNTPRDMEYLIKTTVLALEEKTLHPLLVIGMFTVRFLAIHPFQDGNGRLSRLLTTLLLLQNHYHYVVYSSLENVIEHNKTQYYLTLRKTQKTLTAVTPNWTPWITFFLASLVKQKNKLFNKIQNIREIEKKLSPLSIIILKLIQDHGQMNISEIEVLTKANRSTLKNKLIELSQHGYIERQGKGPSTRYVLNLNDG